MFAVPTTKEESKDFLGLWTTQSMPQERSKVKFEVVGEGHEGMDETDVDMTLVDNKILIDSRYIMIYEYGNEDYRREIEELIDEKRGYERVWKDENDYIFVSTYVTFGCRECRKALVGFVMHVHSTTMFDIQWECGHKKIGHGHPTIEGNPDRFEEGFNRYKYKRKDDHRYDTGHAMARGKSIAMAKGIKEAEAQGRTDTIKRCYKKIKVQDGLIWEFGKAFDLSDERQAGYLLNLTAQWLRQRCMPRNVNSFIAWAQSWIEAKKHRKMLLRILQQAGDPYAKLMLSSQTDKFTQERLDNWKFDEAQFLPDLISLAWLLVAMWGIYSITKNQKFLDNVGTFIGNVNRVAKPVSGILDAVDTAVDHITRAGKSVLEFLNDLVRKVSSKFESMDAATKVMLHNLVRVVLAIVAFEFARTMFPDIYRQVRDYVAAQFGYKVRDMKYESVEAQSSGEEDEGILNDIFAFICDNFVKVPYNKFYGFCEKLPKVVSVARAIQWIFENFGKLIGWIKEVWTGEPHPRTQLELDIQAFYVAAMRLEQEMPGMPTEVLFSEEVQLLIKQLEIDRTRLNNLVTRSTEMRPVFTGRFLAADSLMVKLQVGYGQCRKRAEKRPVPVWVYIYGEAGIGKSRDLEQLYVMVWNYLAKHSTLVEGPFHNGHLYELNQSEEFFDGYKQQIFATIDDIFQTKDPDTRAMTAARMIHFVSPAQYSLRVATVEEKAHCFFTSRCIFSTSNTAPDKITDTKLSCPEALTSRISLALERKVDGYYPDRLTPLEIEGSDEGPFSLEDIAMVIAESIIYRDRQKHEEVPNITPDKMPFSLTSARLTFKIESQGVGDDEKGKEKEDFPEISAMVREIALARGIRISYEESVEISKMTGDIGRNLIAFEVTRRGHNSAGLVPNINESLNDFDFRAKKFSDRFDQARKKCNDKKVRSWTEYLHTYCNKEEFLKEHWNPLKRIFSKKGDGWFWTNMCNPAEVGLIFSQNPELFLWPLDGPAPETWEDWTRKCFSYDEHEGDYYDDRWRAFYPQMSFEARKMDAQKIDMDGAYLKSAARTPLAISFPILLAQAALVGIITYKIVKMILPSSAHVSAQAAYEEKVEKKTRVVRRAAIKKRDNTLRKGKATSQGGTSELAKMVAANGECLEVRLSAPDESWDVASNNPVVSSSWITFVFGNCALVPRHVMFGAGLRGEKRWFSLVRNFQYNTNEEEIDIIGDIASDVILVRFPGYPEKRNISKLFVDSVPSFGRMMHIQPDVRDTSYLPQVAIGFENKMQEIPVNDSYEPFETDAIFYGINNKKGMCGTMYVHEATGKIVAMHMGGNPGYSTGYGVLLQKSDLLAHDPRYELLDPIPGEKTVAQGIEGVSVVGTLPRKMGVFMPKESSLKHGLLNYRDFPVLETDSAPAKLGPFIKDGKLISPLANACAKLAAQYRPPAVHKKVETVIDFLPKDFIFSNVKVCSIEEAIYGIPGYMKSIDFSASSGYFYKKQGLSRRDLCFDKEGNPRIHPRLRADVELREHAMRKGVVYPVVFEEQLKDELKTKEKSEAGMTRLFSSGDFASFVLQRMYLGTFFTELTKDPVGSPIGLSINPHSSQWGLLHARLRGILVEKRKVRAGDFTNYDFSIKNEVKERFEELLSCCFSTEDYEVVERIVEANFQGYHIMGIIVFIRPWGTSSGSFITSMFNSFCNWYLHKTAFVNLFTEKEWKVVETTFTGDDSVVSVPQKYEIYDMPYLARFFKDAFGMIYTSPTKTDNMDLDWDQLIYLKRQFVMGHMGVMAPLDKKSLANMVKWTDTNQDEEVLSSILQSVLLEAWHHGREFYDQCYVWCREESRRLNVKTDIRSFDRMSSMRSDDY